MVLSYLNGGLGLPYDEGEIGSVYDIMSLLSKPTKFIVFCFCCPSGSSSRGRSGVSSCGGPTPVSLYHSLRVCQRKSLGNRASTLLLVVTVPDNSASVPLSGVPV